MKRMERERSGMVRMIPNIFQFLVYALVLLSLILALDQNVFFDCMLPSIAATGKGKPFSIGEIPSRARTRPAKMDFDIQDFLATDFFLKVQNTTSPLEVFRVLSEFHHGMPLFPFTFLAHCVLVALKLRSDPEVFKYVHHNPAVSLVCFVIIVQTGGLLAAVLLGSPPIEVFIKDGDIPTVGIAASVWFLTFFSPFDLFYRVCSLSLTKLLLEVTAYLRKARNTMSGVLMAAALYPAAPIVMVITGVLRGTGTTLGVNLFKLLCVGQGPEGVAFRDKVNVTFTTKVTFLLSLLYTLNEAGVMRVTRPELLFATALSAIFIHVASHLLNMDDLLSGPTHLLWGVFSCLSPTPLKRAAAGGSRKGRHEKED